MPDEEPQDVDLGDDEQGDAEGHEQEQTAFELVDEALENLVLQNPERGVEAIRERFRQNDGRRNKLLSKTMSKLRATEQEKEQLRGVLLNLNERLESVRQKSPEMYDRLVAVMKGEEGGASAPSKPEPKVETVQDLMKVIRTEMRDELTKVKQELSGAYRADKTASVVDQFLKGKPEKIRKHRDRMVELMQSNEGITAQQAAAAADPVAFAEMVVSASRRTDLPGGDRGVDETQTPTRKKFTTFADALRDAKRQARRATT